MSTALCSQGTKANRLSCFSLNPAVSAVLCRCYPRQRPQKPFSTPPTLIDGTPSELQKSADSKKRDLGHNWVLWVGGKNGPPEFYVLPVPPELYDRALCGWKEDSARPNSSPEPPSYLLQTRTDSRGISKTACVGAGPEATPSDYQS